MYTVCVMQQIPDNARRFKAVTLLEMVIAMSMMAIVLASVFPLFAGIRKSWDTKQANTEILQNARVLADHFHRHLATAASITDVSPSSEDHGYIEFVANDGSACRYAVGGDRYVRFGLLGDAGDLAGPVSQFKLTCYDDRDFETPLTDPARVRLVTATFTFPNPAPLGRERTFVTSVYIRSESVFEPGVAVADLIGWGGQGTVIDSYRSTAGAYDPAKPGAEAIVTANATGFGTITLVGRTVIRGDVYIGPGGNPDFGILTWGGSKILGKQGALAEAVDLLVSSAPRGSVFDGSHEGDLLLWGTGNKTIKEDHYFNRVELRGRAKLIVGGHVTLLVNDVFNVGDRSEIKILHNSTLTVYARNSIGIWGSAKVNDSTRDPSRLRVYIIGRNKALDMANDAVLHGVVENPDGRVSLWNAAQLFGKVKAEYLFGGGQVHVDLDCSFSSGGRRAAPVLRTGSKPSAGGRGSQRGQSRRH